MEQNKLIATQSHFLDFFLKLTKKTNFIAVLIKFAISNCSKS